MTVAQLVDTLHYLFDNIVVILALVALYNLLLASHKYRTPWIQTVLHGALFGLAGISSLLAPIRIAPGVQFDGRTIAIAAAVLFNGWRSGLIAALLVVIVRVVMGGAGTVTGILLALSIVPIVHVLFVRRLPRPTDITSRQFLTVGIVLAVQAWVFAVFLGPDLFVPTLRLIVLPTIIAQPLGMTAIGMLLRDTVRKREIREELAETKARFQELTDHIDQVFWIYDLHTRRMVYVSPKYEQVTGQPASTLYDNPRALFSLMEPEDRPNQSDFWTWILQANRPPEKNLLECRIFRPDGVITWIAVRAFPLFDAENHVYRIVGTLVDISERKRAEQERIELQVERSNTALLRQFINDVSHDFRTPLSIVSMSAYLLGRSLKEPSQLQRVDDMQAQVNRMTQVIENMVMLSRLYDGQLDIHREKRDLRDLMDDVIRRTESLLKVKSQHLSVSKPSAPLWVDIDFHYMSIALMSIVNNAIQYTPEGGAIVLTVSNSGDMAQVCVEDTGVGIPAEDLPHIFERFYRVDKARGVDTGGSGLGLAIAQKVVESHGGQIEARSQPGKGSCFEISLPILDARKTESLPRP